MAILAETPKQLERLTSGLSSEELRQPLGLDERSITEALAHLINCEARSSEAIYLTLLVDEPLIPDIHPERKWGKLLRLELFECSDLLTYFKLRRLFLLRVLHSLTEPQWSKVMRAEGKQHKESVFWRARTIALHELDHVTDLVNKIRA